MTEIGALIIDDEEFCVQALIEDINWEKCGITNVQGVSSVRQAKRCLSEMKWNILICDIEMPGENGLELVEWVTEWARLCGMPVECIMLTCHPEYDFIRKAMQLGCMDYLLKPVDINDMETSLKKAEEKIRESGKKLRSEPKLESEAEDKGVVYSRIIPYIEKNIEHSFSVTELAESVPLNPQYMMRLFKKTTGMSVLEYVTGYRIRLSKEMLAKTDWSLELIAEKIGYYSAGYFIKVFKRLEHMTPGEYRKKYGRS